MTPAFVLRSHRHCCSLIALLVVFAVSAGEAAAQCPALDLLRKQAEVGAGRSKHVEQHEIRTAADVGVWKTITLGTTRNALGLRNALSAAACSVGDRAEELLARPAFTVSAAAMDLDLVVLSARELGARTDTVPLIELYTRARRLGFELVPAEAGPQLRLQYSDQPVGEFLHLAMEPIATWRGEDQILIVANAGAGLILIAQDAHVEVGATSRFVFMRPRELASK